MHSMSPRRAGEKERIEHPSQKYLQIYTCQKNYVTKLKGHEILMYYNMDEEEHY